MAAGIVPLLQFGLKTVATVSFTEQSGHCADAASFSILTQSWPLTLLSRLKGPVQETRNGHYGIFDGQQRQGG
jgi:hypothetical protein